MEQPERTDNVLIESGTEGGYPIVDTGQIEFYSDTTKISRPNPVDDFYG